MSFLAPVFLWAGLLALPIIILYMLKLRRREVQVSSTLLWQLLLRDREANTPWQRLRRNLLLLLQLLTLAALVIALARPFLFVPTVAAGRMVILLDASASMKASDVKPSRFAAGQQVARQIIDGLAGNSRSQDHLRRLTLILASARPETIANATNDKAELRRALDSAQPSDGAADWPAAFSLAAGAAGQRSSDQATIVIISDGGLPDDLPPLPGEVRYAPVGESADNLAISALSLRPAPGGPQLFASVGNYGDESRDVILSLTVNGEFFYSQQLSVPAGDSTDLILSDLPDGTAIYRASLSLPPSAESAESVDSFHTDDAAWAVYSPPTSGRTLLISQGNIFLEQALAALPGLEPYRAPADAPLPEDPFDLYAFDGVITDALPPKPLLIVNPPATTSLLSVGEVFTNTSNIRAIEDPLTQFTDFGNIHILQARKVTTPDWAKVLVTSDGGPLILAGETGGRRVVILTFDLHESDLPLQVAFPILVANLINYLGPAQPFSAPDGLRPGETLTIRPGVTTTGVVIQTPGGKVFAARPGEQGVIFADTHELGVYAVTLSQGSDVQRQDYFAVNLFSPDESNIRVRPTITVGRTQVRATPPQERGQRELWPWLAAVAVGLLLFEWWMYHTSFGISVPGPYWNTARHGR